MANSRCRGRWPGVASFRDLPAEQTADQLDRCAAVLPRSSRKIDSLQMTAKHRVATPADWKQGEDVIIAGSVFDDEAKTIYPKGWKAPKPYIRIVPQPR